MGAQFVWPVAIVAGVLVLTGLVFWLIRRGGRDAQARKASEVAAQAERKAGEARSGALDEERAIERTRRRSGVKKNRRSPRRRPR